MRQKNGEPYELNSKKQILQTFVWLKTNFDLPVPKKAWELLQTGFKLEKDNSKSATKQKQETEQVPYWDDYLEQNEDAFGSDSKKYLVASLYSELPLRDDFKRLVIQAPTKSNNIPNFIHVPKTGRVHVYISEFNKTSKGGTFAPVDKKLSSGLSNLVRRYIKAHGLIHGKPLLGGIALSTLVSKMNKELGYEKAGTTFFRKMSAPPLDNNLSNEEKLRIAEEMKHSTDSQAKYMRKRLPRGHWRP